MKMFARVSGSVIGALIAAFALLILWPRQAAPLADPADSRVIHNVRIVDVASGTAGELASVEIRDGIISKIGSGIEAADLPAMDGQGGFLVPGFWDMHVHTFQSSPQSHLPLWIANGVTSVRDMMDCPKTGDALIACGADKRRWNGESAAGRLTAPRIVEVASYYLESPELTPSEAAARVQMYDARGLDAIKVYNSLSPKAYFAAAGEARARRLRLVGHLPKAISLEQAIHAGQTSFEHAHLLARHCFDGSDDWRTGKLDGLPSVELTEMIVADHDRPRCDQAIAALADAGSWFVPTHVTREEDARASDPAFTDDPQLDYLDPLSRWAWGDDLNATTTLYPGARGEKALAAYFEHGLRLTGRAHDGGVRILVGTDTALGGIRYHDEMTHLVRAGLSPAEVLRAATLNAAIYANEEQTSGSIAVGKRADLVLLGGNPLVEIANTRKIRAVFLGGRLYDRGRLDEVNDFVREQAAAPHNWAKLLWGFARSSVSADL